MSDIKQEAVARLIGRLKYEPELRKTKNNKQFVNLTVESVGDDDGRDFKTSHKAILWGHDAEDFMGLAAAQGRHRAGVWRSEKQKLRKQGRPKGLVDAGGGQGGSAGEGRTRSRFHREQQR
jgi:hypothetical protein